MNQKYKRTINARITYNKLHRSIKSLKKNIILYISLPHVWTLIIIIIVAIIAERLSALYINKKPFLSSLFANIFAGLLTGVTISLISTIKAVTLYRTECLIEWLNSLHEIILRYLKTYREIIKESKGLEIDDNVFQRHHCNSFEDKVYCTLYFASEVEDTILNDMLNQSLPFNSYKYINKKFGYDTMEYCEINERRINKISNLSESEMTTQVLEAAFKKINCQLMDLNGKILDDIKYLQVRKNAIHISFM